MHLFKTLQIQKVKLLRIQYGVVFKRVSNWDLGDNVQFPLSHEASWMTIGQSLYLGLTYLTGLL